MKGVFLRLRRDITAGASKRATFSGRKLVFPSTPSPQLESLEPDSAILGFAVVLGVGEEEVSFSDVSDRKGSGCDGGTMEAPIRARHSFSASINSNE